MEVPSSVLPFLGIEMDAALGLSRLPVGKFIELQSLILRVFFLKVTLLDFPLLLGHLNFACSVVVPGRAFIVCLCASTSKIAPSHTFIHTSSMK